MKDNSLSKLGGICCIVLGVLYVLFAIFYLADPVQQAIGTDEYWPKLAQNPPVHVLSNWAWALVGVLGLVTVPAISQLVRAQNEGWVRWMSNLALLGYAVQAINSFRALALEPGIGAAYVAGPAATQAALQAISVSLDPQGWLVDGGVGLWLLVISLLALRGDVWPKVLAYLGIAAGILYWLALAGNVLEIQTLVQIAAGAAIIVGPVFLVWMGLRLRAAEGS